MACMNPSLPSKGLHHLSVSAADTPVSQSRSKVQLQNKLDDESIEETLSRKPIALLAVTQNSWSQVRSGPPVCIRHVTNSPP